MITAAMLLLSIAALVALFPRSLAYPTAPIATWNSGALLYRAYRLRRRAKGT